MRIEIIQPTVSLRIIQLVLLLLKLFFLLLGLTCLHLACAMFHKPIAMGNDTIAQASFKNATPFNLVISSILTFYREFKVWGIL